MAECPFFIEFLDRVQLLRQIFRNEGGLDELGHGLHGVRVQIRRAHLVEDGLTVFRQLKADGRLKERLRITFINKEGLEEAGVDGGGVYKEFLNQLVYVFLFSPFAFFADYFFFGQFHCVQGS